MGLMSASRGRGRCPTLGVPRFHDKSVWMFQSKSAQLYRNKSAGVSPTRSATRFPRKSATMCTKRFPIESAKRFPRRFVMMELKILALDPLLLDLDLMQLNLFSFVILF